MNSIILIVIYVLFIVSLLGGAIYWARKKKREIKDPSARLKLTPTTEFFVKELPKNWYVSFQFCLGFALAGFVAVLLHDFVLKSQ